MFRTKVEGYFKTSADAIPWNFDDELVLGRITRFQERLGQIKVRRCTPQSTPKTRPEFLKL